MQILAKTKNLEELVLKYDDLQTSTITSLKDEFAIVKSGELEKYLEELKNSQRLLKIGIVGRVKAGKSSLLNALVFNGADVLPKAATPMTAALTMIEYDENLSAIVELYKQADINEIENQHSQYIKELNRLKDIKFMELKERKEKKLDAKLSKEDIKDIEEKAEKSAKRELNDNLILSSSYDQFERIKANPLKLKDEFVTIKANNINELNKELLEYVGANGRFMPYTKSVTLKLNEESLKNIQIIDTPGVNDPIVSREARTKELLHKCDVVFIVSPSGQFLNQEDTNLMDRLGNKDGVNELFVIASKMDEQLYGSLKTETNEDLDLALDKLKTSFTKQLKDYCEEQEKECEYAKALWQNLSKNEVITSSGMAYSILNHLGSLDENEEHVMNLLRMNYPNYFNEKNTKENLKKLANIELVKEKLNYVKELKDELLNKKSNEFISAKTNDFNDFIKELEKLISNDLKSLKDMDLGSLKKQEQELAKAKEVASKELSKRYKEHINEIDEKIKKHLQNTAKAYFSKENENVDDSVSTETKEERYTEWESRRRTRSTSKWWNPFSWGSTETYYEDVPVTRYRTITTTNVMAGTIHSGLIALTNKLEELISLNANEYLNSWKKNLSKIVMQTLRENMDREFIDEIIIAKAINKVISSIKTPDISYSSKMPSSLNRSGRLSDSEGKNYVAEVKNYLDSLEVNVISDINNFITNILKHLQNKDLSGEIFLSCQKELNKLALDIENKEAAIKTKETILKEIKKLGE